MNCRRLLTILLLAACSCAIGANSLLAAPVAYKANIEEGARFDLSPVVYVLEFQQPVLLTSIELLDQDGVKVSIPPLTRAVRVQFIELPLLAPHGYRLSWLGKSSGGQIAGSVGFVVAGCRNEKQVSAPAKPK